MEPAAPNCFFSKTQIICSHSSGFKRYKHTCSDHLPPSVLQPPGSPEPRSQGFPGVQPVKDSWCINKLKCLHVPQIALLEPTECLTLAPQKERNLGGGGIGQETYTWTLY